MKPIRLVAALAVAIAMACLALAAKQQAPVFRGRVDLMQLDVTVLDRKGLPVRGLTKDDFTLLEDNTPQTIQGFTAIDLPDRVIGGPAWSDRVASDVTSNEIDGARVFVLLLDDGLSMGVVGSPPEPDGGAVKLMKAGAEAFLKSLGPRDLAAVLFTQRSHLSQNLTGDKAKLIAAIRAFPSSGGGDLLPQWMLNPKTGRGLVIVPGTECLGPVRALGVMEGLIRVLGALPDRRKAILYFGGVFPWEEEPDKCTVYQRWRDIFAAAQQTNVTINPVDTMGLRRGGTVGAWATYGAAAENTGGRAVIGNNDLKPGLERIRVENSSYYLLAYAPTKELEDGTFRRLTVKVKGRSDVEIVSRRNYWAPRVKPADAPAPPPPPEIEAMAGLLPKADLKLRATAAAFAVPGTERATVAIALGIKQPPLLARTPENVEIIVKAFTADGNASGSDTQMIPITVPAARADAELSRYEVLARLELPKPGKYELRLSAKSSVSGTTGAVYVDVEVPDFLRTRVSLSGLVLSALPAPGPVAPARGLPDLTPLPPTTERTFTAADLVTAILRVYQGGTDGLAPVTMKVRIADAADKTVFENSQTVPPERFANARAGDFQVRLPLAELKQGHYLLTVQASVGKNTASRESQFTIR